MAVPAASRPNGKECQESETDNAMLRDSYREIIFISFPPLTPSSLSVLSLPRHPSPLPSPLSSHPILSPCFFSSLPLPSPLT